MYKIKETARFHLWFKRIKDPVTRATIRARLLRLLNGNFGDHKSLGDGISELRIRRGQGYRIYYTIRRNELVILLAGGVKRTQPEDIKLAKKMAKEV